MKIGLEWRADNQPLRITAGGHTVSSWEYEPSGRLNKAHHHNIETNGASKGTVTKTHAYDTRGRHTSTTWDIPGLGQTPGAGGGGAAGGVAQVIVGNGGSPHAGDQSVIDRLENDLGYTVTIVDDGAPENVSGVDLIVITQSVGTSQITGKYVDEAIPVLTMSTPTWDEHNLVTSQSSGYPFTTSDTLDLEQAGHATVTGATAPTATTGVPTGYAFDADVPSDAEIIAAAKATHTDRASLIVFETGDKDAANVAVPERRALLGFHRNAFANLTAGGGWTVFDNTIAWLHPTPAAGGGGGGPQTISYTYNEAGHSNTVTYPDGVITNTDYNALGQPIRLSAGPITIVDQVAYNARGQLTNAVVGIGTNQLTRTWAYESWSDRLLNQTSHRAGGVNVQDLAYGYDTGGNITLMRDQTAGIDQWQCFSYDNLDRLTIAYTRSNGFCNGHEPASGPDPYNVTFSYNAIGNITSATGTGTVNGGYAYGGGPAGPHAATTAGSNSYSYDQSGNMTTRTTSIGAQTLTYDVQNRLQTITGAGPDMTALYDADGNRVKRTLANTDTYYLGPNYEVTVNDNATEIALHHGLAGQHMASGINGQLTTVTSDKLGTAIGAIDVTGSLTAQRYTPHGVNRSATNNLLPFDFTFTGQTDDPGTGLIDYNARHYDPNLGRFIQADTILDGLNRYTYVHNNPIRYSDPTGHCAQELFDRCLDTIPTTGRSTSLGTTRLVRATNLNGTDVRAVQSMILELQVDDQDARAGNSPARQWATYLFDKAVRNGTVVPNPDGGYMLADCQEDARCKNPWMGGVISERLLGVRDTTLDEAIAWQFLTGASLRLVAGPAAGPAGAGGCSNSFAAGTQVLMADGSTKNIEDVEVGDAVMAMDPETGEAGGRKVTAVWPHRDWLLAFDVEDGSVATTEDHHFWNASDGEWQETQHLDWGDLLLTATGGQVAARGLDWSTLTYGEAYDLTVAGLHSYFVQAGDESALVHNCTPLTKAERRLLGGLANKADSTAFRVLRSRGGGASNVRGAGLQTNMGQWTLRDVAHAAARGDRQAQRWIKMIKQAGSQGKGGK